MIFYLCKYHTLCICIIIPALLCHIIYWLSLWYLGRIYSHVTQIFIQMKCFEYYKVIKKWKMWLPVKLLRKHICLCSHHFDCRWPGTLGARASVDSILYIWSHAPFNNIEISLINIRIMAQISNLIHVQWWNIITHPCFKFNSQTAIELRTWISNYIQ